MKHRKILGLLAVAAMAMMAFAASASATNLTSPAGTTYFGEVHATSEGHAVLHNPIAVISCESTVSGPVTVNGEAGAASGDITTLDFGPCTNSWHVTTPAGSGGTLSIEAKGGNTGALSSSGATVEATRFGVNCRYRTNNTPIGTVTGGEHATLHIEAKIPFHNGSPLCGSEPTLWTGAYKVNTPTNVTID